MENPLNEAELARYARHLALPGFGEEGQMRLKTASVLVVGAGGLGSPLLLYLAAAGVGHIGIVDPDLVDDSNLQRQVLYTIHDVGQPKARAARSRLLALNPHIRITAHDTALTRHNALDLIKDYDIVADGTDNFPTRYLINDACVLLNKVNVHASISRFEGRVAVFNLALPDGSRSPNYRDVFPSPPPPGLVPDCAEGGVLGVLPGIIGSMQAVEVIKVATGLGEPLSGRMFLFNAATFESHTLRINKTDVRISELVDYKEFCGLSPNGNKGIIKKINMEDFHRMKEQGMDFQLIDVREPHEYEAENLGGELLPLGQLEEWAARVSKDKQVVIHCRSGKRSAAAIRQLQASQPFDNLYNLEGGILAYMRRFGDKTI